jgi:two-component system, chemotaxis family, protein-glutamate methylesterase/glutaminase
VAPEWLTRGRADQPIPIRRSTRNPSAINPPGSTPMQTEARQEVANASLAARQGRLTGLPQDQLRIARQARASVGTGHRCGVAWVHRDGVRRPNLRRSAMVINPTPWVVAIGASGADGLGDIKELLTALPPTLAAAVMIVFHRGWGKPTHLRAVLSRVSALPIIIADQGERLIAGTVYIGEPSEHLTLARNSFSELIDDPQRKYGGRTVDLLFKSVAAGVGKRMIGVVLSGSLDDGARGLAAIHHSGGTTMVLTPAASPQRGMPENAIKFDGPIDFIGNPQDIAKAICEVCGC